MKYDNKVVLQDVDIVISVNSVSRKSLKVALVLLWIIVSPPTGMSGPFPAMTYGTCDQHSRESLF